MLKPRIQIRKGMRRSLMAFAFTASAALAADGFAGNVTVSWCKFYYTADTGHHFVNLIGADDSHTADLDLNGDCVIHLYEYSFLPHNWLGGIE